MGCIPCGTDLTEEDLIVSSASSEATAPVPNLAELMRTAPDMSVLHDESSLQVKTDATLDVPLGLDSELVSAGTLQSAEVADNGASVQTAKTQPVAQNTENRSFRLRVRT